MALNSTPGSLSAETARRDRLQNEPGARRGDGVAARPGHFAGLMQAHATAASGTAGATDGVMARVQAARIQAARVAEAGSDRARDAQPPEADAADTTDAEPSARASTPARSGRPLVRSTAHAGIGESAGGVGAEGAARRSAAGREDSLGQVPPWLSMLDTLRRLADPAETGKAGAAVGADAAALPADRAADAAAGRGARLPAAGGGVAQPALGDVGASGSPEGRDLVPQGVTPVAADGFAQAVQTLQASAGGATASAGSRIDAPPVQQSVPVPVHDPEFGAQVMLQVGGLVQAGVTEAQLHLNPAEMGPIRIHIAMEGQSARIDFEASHADTRALLESALPALAEALQGEGLQLDRGTVVQVADLPVPTSMAANADASRQGGQPPGREGMPEAPLHAGAAAASVAAARGGPAGADSPRPLPGWDPLARRTPSRAGGLDLYA